MHIQRLQLQRAHLNSSSPTSDTSIWDSVRSPSSALAVHVGAPTELLLKCGLLLALVRLAGVHARIPRWHTGHTCIQARSRPGLDDLQRKEPPSPAFGTALLLLPGGSCLLP